MEIKRVLKNIDVFLKYVLIAILLLSFLMYMVVFLINWEGFIFGVRLAGTSAGIYLFLKAIGAGLLAFLLIRYRQYTLAVAALAALYFGYTFADSAVTIQTLTDKLYSPFLLVLFVISLVFLMFHVLAGKYNKGDDRPTMIESAIHSVFTIIEKQETDGDKILLGSLLVLAAFIAVIFIFPLTVAFLHWLIEILSG
ncbi:hypothetical protein L1S32_10590 [Methanogenium sp. S4BF]|uniref:hypothetical protein n=1 Tax=Methanogenium sp. S4BF TaxID=1789226 RepID=UPI002416A284|nr:hypothetical protein [Methanogenium sp. S4BF]WFN34279.1 hypothetical protein L1S32_10590 [Methanogenium sp. S4BF]